MGPQHTEFTVTGLGSTGGSIIECEVKEVFKNYKSTNLECPRERCRLASLASFKVMCVWQAVMAVAVQVAARPEGAAG